MSYSKYNAKPTYVDGRRFASKREAARFVELKDLERAGIISKLELQPEFSIAINGKHCFKYFADFAYQEGGTRVIEDVKSEKTAKLETYRLKKKCVEAAYGITIREVGIKPKPIKDTKSKEIEQVWREATRRRA